MPRKQRFKPSRKPQQPQQPVVQSHPNGEPHEGFQPVKEPEKPAPVGEQTGDADEIIR